MVIRNDFATTAGMFTLPQNVTAWLACADYQSALSTVLSESMPDDMADVIGDIETKISDAWHRYDTDPLPTLADKYRHPETAAFLKNYFVEAMPYAPELLSPVTEVYKRRLSPMPSANEARVPPPPAPNRVEPVRVSRRPEKTKRTVLAYDIVQAGLFEILKEMEKSGDRELDMRAVREALYLLNKGRSGKSVVREVLRLLLLKKDEVVLSATQIDAVISRLEPIMDKASQKTSDTVITELRPHIAGRRGPLTSYMKSQIADFEVFVRNIGPAAKGRSSIELAYECWNAHKDAWEDAAKAAKGDDAHGYTSYKSLAAAYDRKHR